MRYCPRVHSTSPRGLHPPLHVTQKFLSSSFWEGVTRDRWVPEIIHKGDTLELTSRPPSSGLVPTNLLPHFRKAMVEEVEGLVREQTVGVVPPDLVHSGFYSTYFLILPNDGGIRHEFLKMLHLPA